MIDSLLFGWLVSSIFGLLSGFWQVKPNEAIENFQFARLDRIYEKLFYYLRVIAWWDEESPTHK